MKTFLSNITRTFKRLPQLLQQIAKRRHGKKILIAAGLIILGIVAGLVFLLGQHGGTATTDTESIKKFGFETLMPTGASVNQVGEWQRISPENTVPVFAYADRIDSVPVSMSQQKLPDSFKENPEVKVAELAKSFNATNTINAGDITAYIGTSAKGPQSVIFTKNDVLVLIKSENKISGDAWSTYIASLK